MTLPQVCPECGAVWQDDRTCTDWFHQALAYDFEDPGGAAWVHHLTVLCFHLQHPSRYSPEGLREARALLDEFIERDASPAEIRRRNRTKLESGNRTWRLTGTPAGYEHPVHWTMTIADVVPGGLAGYPDRVRQWADAVHAALKG